MYSLADLPDKLPLFVLPGALLLPRARLPLHIFEPRYLAMFDDALKTEQRLIGMVQPRRDDTLEAVGCAGRITDFSEMPDRRYMITLTGISRFRLGTVEESFAPYPRARAEWAEFSADTRKPVPDSAFDRERFLGLVSRYFAQTGLEADWDSLRAAEDAMLIDSLSVTLPFEPEDKQALLEAPDLCARREVLEALMEFSRHAGDEKERLQ